MLTLTARVPFRLTDLNLGQIFDAPKVWQFVAVASAEAPDVRDEGLVLGQADGSRAILRGTGIDFPDTGRPSGQIESLSSYSETGSLLFKVEGLDVSLNRLDQLADTYTFRDDAAFWINRFAGDDTFKLSSGDDYVSGFAGNDTLYGRAGTDQLYGGSGQDVLRGGAGSDVLEGGDGDDDARGGSGKDLIHGDDGDDVLRGQADNDLLRGGAGMDNLGGGTGDDRVEGGSGADILNGGDGFDLLFGGTGDDRLNGGTGYNTLTGGTGADVFVFRLEWQRTTLADFDPDFDTLKVRISALDELLDLSFGTDDDGLVITLVGGIQIVLPEYGIADVQESWFDFG